MTNESSAFPAWTSDDFEMLAAMVPPGVATQNPINQVYFRAGLLACREYMARFVKQAGDATTANSIRLNWWPSLGEDPGPPRQYDFAEVAEEITPHQWAAKTISPNIEALAIAWQFLRDRLPPASPLPEQKDDLSE
jgi:hypothetical protein